MQPPTWSNRLKASFWSAVVFDMLEDQPPDHVGCYCSLRDDKGAGKCQGGLGAPGIEEPDSLALTAEKPGRSSAFWSSGRLRLQPL